MRRAGRSGGGGGGGGEDVKPPRSDTGAYSYMCIYVQPLEMVGSRGQVHGADPVFWELGGGGGGGGGVYPSRDSKERW